jgi:hypothetical protein
VWPRGQPGRSCWQQADTSSEGPKCPSARVLHGLGALAKPGAKRQTQAGVAGWPDFDPDFAEEPGLIEPYLSAIQVRPRMMKGNCFLVRFAGDFVIGESAREFRRAVSNLKREAPASGAPARGERFVVSCPGWRLGPHGARYTLVYCAGRDFRSSLRTPDPGAGARRFLAEDACRDTALFPLIQPAHRRQSPTGPTVNQFYVFATSARCAQTFSKALTYWSVNSGACP